MTNGPSRSQDLKNTLDVEFYTSYYPDLASFEEGQARDHFFRFGLPEQRHPNPEAMIAALEREFGALDPDFDLDRHRDLHPHLRRRPHYPWEVIEHYLRHRATLKAAALKGKRGRPAGPPSRVIRSEVEALRSDLIVLFGPERADLALVRAVSEAAAGAAAHPTPATPFLEAGVLARYLLSAPGASGGHLDSFDGQLDVLYYGLFDSAVLARSRAEMAAVNRLIPAVIAFEMAPAAAGRPPLTLFMLAARAASGLAVDRADQEADDYVADFFARLVIERRLQPFITPQQRAMLRQVATAPHPPIPLAALYRQHVGPGLLPGPDVADAAAFNAWFWETGVWRRGLDYVLSGEALGEPDPGPEPPAPLPTSGRASHLALRWRPGAILTFGLYSDGADHCVGPGWRAKTGEQEWRGGGDLLLALRLAEEDATALDLFLGLRILKGEGTERVSVAWNGRPVADWTAMEIEGGGLCAPLGSRHRTGREANILSLALHGGGRVNRKRPPRLALNRLILARR